MLSELVANIWGALAVLALVSAVSFVGWQLWKSNRRLTASNKFNAREVAAQIIRAVGEDGRTVWTDQDTRRVTYCILGHTPGERRVWVRFKITRLSILAVIECSWRASTTDHDYAELIRAAFVEQGVESVIAYPCDEPMSSEMFIYPAPGTECIQQHA